MTATAERRFHTPTPRPPRPASAWRASVLAPVAAGVATLCAATSLTSVVGGLAWFGYLFVAVLLIAATGLALRSLQVPTIVVGLAQLLVLLMLITGAFTTHGILQIIPGPDAFDEIRQTLAAAADQIRTGLPPVEGTPPILCLVTIAIGLVAVLVDTLAVAAAAPAATGLVLLCVYAVPAALADEMLPWWTFLLGAAAFAGLLAVDGNHRHRSWRTREAPGRSGKQGVLSAPVAVVSAAIVLGLFGGAISWVGTIGKIPFGAGADGRGSGTGGFGIQPFTELRGMLDQGTNGELFRVSGLGQDKKLLRALTLDTYTPDKGWGLLNDGKSQQGSPVGRILPPAPGDDGSGVPRSIRIEPVNWRDNWLPVYGAPRMIDNAGGNYLYNQVSGTIFTTKSEVPPTYTETASLREPTADELRVTPPVDDLPPGYTQIADVDPRVVSLTEQLVAGSSNDFDKASAIWRYFTAQNGFVYDTKTADTPGMDALADFILKGKRGFCEQFASAMAVMLRVAHIPSRVALGFTPGVQAANDVNSLSIGTQDAHAWVEVYFGAKGWVAFDPTPLSDGRGITPPYLKADPSSGAQPNDTQEVPSTAASSAPATGAPRDQDPNQPQNQQQQGTTVAPFWWVLLWFLAGIAALCTALTGIGIMLYRRRPEAEPVDLPPQTGLRAVLQNWLPLITTTLWITVIGLLTLFAVGWWAGLIVVLFLMVLVGPAAARDVGRRRRLQAIAAHRPGAADAAWNELLAECADRGVPIPTSDTVRVAGQKLASKHHLDDEGKDGLRTVIGVVERSWYSEDDTPDATLRPAFDHLRRSLHRNAPMSWRGRLFPRSIFKRRD